MADPFVDGLPDDALVLLVGPAGAGKSTWAGARFAPAAVLSADAFRTLVAGDASDQSATSDAFKVLHTVAWARLRRGLLTVADATNLTAGARRSLRRMAGEAGRPTVVVVFDISLDRCLQQNAARPGRSVPEAVVRRHREALPDVLARLPREGYAAILHLRDADMDGTPLW